MFARSFGPTPAFQEPAFEMSPGRTTPTAHRCRGGFPLEAGGVVVRTGARALMAADVAGADW
jgi:hypothetical protein